MRPATSTAISPTALAPLSLVQLQHIRGIIFGKHGRGFEDSTLQHWLLTRAWYRPDASFTSARLSSRERENLDVVREAEAKKHPQIEAGDMRFYQNRVITTAMLGEHTPQDWEVLEAEVLANHGFFFGYADSQEPDDLQTYFDQRYWYQPRPEFKASDLSAIERQNRDTIAVAAMRQNKRPLAPGMMNLFQSTSLTQQMLSSISIADLRLLRNEIYARHGRGFETPWLAEYFRQQPWYTPRHDYTDAELSSVERQATPRLPRRRSRGASSRSLPRSRPERAPRAAPSR